MMNFCALMAEICRRVWAPLQIFNGFRVLVALLHGTLVVGVIQTLRRWTAGATYIRQDGHHVGHWPTFQLCIFNICFSTTCWWIKNCHNQLLWKYHRTVDGAVMLKMKRVSNRSLHNKLLSYVMDVEASGLATELHFWLFWCHACEQRAPA